MYGKLKKLYYEITDYNLIEGLKGLIRKIVLINGLVLVSSIWFLGLPIAIVYSIILLLLIKKYVRNLSMKYGILLAAMKKISSGNLDVAIEESLGLFEPLKEDVITIQKGFKKA